MKITEEQKQTLRQIEAGTAAAEAIDAVLARLEWAEAELDAVVDHLGDFGHDYERQPAAGVKVLASRLDDALNQGGWSPR